MMRRVQVHPVPWSISMDSENAWKQLDEQFISSVQIKYGQTTVLRCFSPTERLEIILTHQNLHVRASDLTMFIDQCPAEALKDNFQLIVDSIFSHRDKEQAWELRSMRKCDYPKESAAVLKLLAPDGPLVTLALRLMDDHNFLLEFPLDGLSLHLRQRLQQFDIPPFFANKFGMPQGSRFDGQLAHHLLLNPFEYFIFCFGAVNLLGLNNGRTLDYLNGWAALQDTLYTNILEDYLVYYFPCDGGGVPCHNFNYNAQQATEAVFLANSLLRQQHSKSKLGGSYQSDSSMTPTVNVQNSLPTLFKSSLLQEQTGAGANRELFLTSHPSAYKEIWRSETILNTFMELWMSGYDSLEKLDTFGSPNTYGGLPSVDIVKCVRSLVRHMHYFTNCVNSHAMHPMDEIKRNAIPVFQRKLYSFLRYIFHYWPLDNSFRIVYETWLSYIQPWRYMQLDRSKNSQQSREAATLAQEAPVDRRWFNFILNNILFYSKLFSQILIRLERMDLSANKNALMFYRIAKVLAAQDSLKGMIVEIENNITQYDKQQAGGPSSHIPFNRQLTFSSPGSNRSVNVRNNTSGPYIGGGTISPSSPGSVGVQQQQHFFAQEMTCNMTKIAQLKQLMKDCESPGYKYEPVFSADNIKIVSVLLDAAAVARDYLIDSTTDKSEDEKSKGILKRLWVSSFDIVKKNIANNNVQEKIKSANQLEFSRNQFALFFEIPITENGSLPSDTNTISRALNSSLLQDLSPFASANCSATSLNSSGQKTVLPADFLIQDDVTPFGNPDTAIVRSDEYGPLVRLLNSLSSYLNDQMQPQIEDIYFTSTWSGSFARAIFAEPVEYTEYRKQRRRCGGLRQGIRYTRYLPPRICLRPLASFYSLIWIFIIYCIALSFGCGFMSLSSLMFFFGLYFIYLTFRATSEPISKLTELRQLHSTHAIIPEPVQIGDGNYNRPSVDEFQDFRFQEGQDRGGAGDMN